MPLAFPFLPPSSSPSSSSSSSLKITFTRRTSGLWLEALNCMCPVSSSPPCSVSLFPFRFYSGYTPQNIKGGVHYRISKVYHRIPKLLWAFRLRDWRYGLAGISSEEPHIVSVWNLWGHYGDVVWFSASLRVTFGPFSWLLNTCMTVHLQKSPSFVCFFFFHPSEATSYIPEDRFASRWFQTGDKTKT
jgi:hypothetical protein